MLGPNFPVCSYSGLHKYTMFHITTHKKKKGREKHLVFIQLINTNAFVFHKDSMFILNVLLSKNYCLRNKIFAEIIKHLILCFRFIFIKLFTFYMTAIICTVWSGAVYSMLVCHFQHSHKWCKVPYLL